jgi:hypothetical protein
MAIRIGRDDAFDATGTALQFLRNCTRRYHVLRRVTILQPTTVHDAVTGRVEGLLDASEPGARWPARVDFPPSVSDDTEERHSAHGASENTDVK